MKPLKALLSAARSNLNPSLSPGSKRFRRGRKHPPLLLDSTQISAMTKILAMTNTYAESFRKLEVGSHRELSVGRPIFYLTIWQLVRSRMPSLVRARCQSRNSLSNGHGFVGRSFPCN